MPRPAARKGGRAGRGEMTSHNVLQGRKTKGNANLATELDDVFRRDLSPIS